VNQKVVSHACSSCPSGKTNAGGDDASGGDTTCDAVTCLVNQKVVSHACSSCPSGKTNAGGDDASGGDTTCGATPAPASNGNAPSPQSTAAGDNSNSGGNGNKDPNANEGGDNGESSSNVTKTTNSVNDGSSDGIDYMMEYGAIGIGVFVFVVVLLTVFVVRRKRSNGLSYAKNTLDDEGLECSRVGGATGTHSRNESINRSSRLARIKETRKLGSMEDFENPALAAVAITVVDSDCWVEHYDPKTELPFYFNTTTGETSWEKSNPVNDGAAAAASSSDEHTHHRSKSSVMPAGWTRYFDPAGNRYYADRAGKVTWDKPAK